MFNLQSGHVVAFLDEKFYDDLCSLALNKKQIHWTEIRKNPKEHWITTNSYAGTDFPKHEVVNAMKSVRIVRKFGADAVRRQD